MNKFAITYKITAPGSEGEQGGRILNWRKPRIIVICAPNEAAAIVDFRQKASSYNTKVEIVKIKAIIQWPQN